MYIILQTKIQYLLNILVLKSLFYLLHEHTIAGFPRLWKKEIEFEIFLIGVTYVALPVRSSSCSWIFPNFLLESLVCYLVALFLSTIGRRTVTLY